MRIGINTLALVPGRSGGDATYTRYLIEHLALIDRENQYYLFVADYNREWFTVEQPNFHQVVCPVPSSFSLRVLWEHSAFWVAVNRMRLDVFHGPVNMLPAGLRGRAVITIHDAVWTRKDQRIPLPVRLYWRIFRPWSAARADRIIVVSETNRKELIGMGVVQQDKVEVIYNGVHERFQPLDRAESRAWAAREHGLDRQYVLWVGRPYASKNLVRLVEGFARFNETTGDRYLLALAGPSGWEDEALREAMQRTGVEPHLRQLGYIDNSNLPRLYNGAEALLFPSLQEACPFPPIEAMACGIPVITSNVSALPEIMGEAAEFVDPLSIESIAQGIEHVLCDPARQAALRELGLARARTFTWTENAARTRALYAAVAAIAATGKR